jgi:DNA-3-methyladenine glycosylase
MKPIPKSFYDRDPVVVAREILGNVLVKEKMEGKIVETEAYYGLRDPASRAFKGKKKMNKWMWESAGTAFIYMVHGNWLFNIITGKKPSGILIRAVEPLKGIKEMLKNRKVSNMKDLTSGPGKFTQAFGITNIQNGMNVSDPSSEIVIIENKKDHQISSSHRIGVSKDLPQLLRFYIKGNEFVSRK